MPKTQVFPKIILLMRHAEKPENPQNPGLSTDGQARAQALVTFIQARYGKPDFIIATAPTRESNRPCETVTPLSQATGVPIHDKIADKDYKILARHLQSHKKYAGKFVVICWHHGEIPELAKALGAKAGYYPNPWTEDVFNLIIEWRNGSSDVTLITEPF